MEFDKEPIISYKQRASCFNHALTFGFCDKEERLKVFMAMVLAQDWANKHPSPVNYENVRGNKRYVS